MLKFLDNKKTILGVILMGLFQSLFDTEVLSEFWFDILNNGARVLFGIGLADKAKKFTEKGK